MTAALSPVTRLCKTTFTPGVGAPFTILCDLDPEQLQALCDKWQRKTKVVSAVSLITYIKNRKPFCICVTQAQYEEATRGKVVHATKEEYDAEQAR